jgi:hypothetical protein
MHRWARSSWRDHISRVAGAILTVLELTPGKPDERVISCGILVSLDERLCCLQIGHARGFEGIADKKRLSIAYNLVVLRDRLCADGGNQRSAGIGDGSTAQGEYR